MITIAINTSIILVITSTTSLPSLLYWLQMETKTLTIISPIITFQEMLIPFFHEGFTSLSYRKLLHFIHHHLKRQTISFIQHECCCSNQIEQSQWYQFLPTKVHQLVITETWNCPTNPHEHKNENNNFNK